MAITHLGTYLNDHLAGATAGIEIADYLIEHSQEPSTKAQLSSVKAEIHHDHETLKSLMKDLNIDESAVRKATGWLSEKGTEIKLAVDDPSGSKLRTFEALELLSLGIEGKRCLWLALATANDQRLSDKDLTTLIQRAAEQREIVEQMRLDAARDAFAA